MKSSSISTLGLALLLSTAPALQANDTENSSWLAPFSTSTFLYPVIGLGAGYLIYKLYTNYDQSADLDVIAPWHEEKSIPNQPTSEQATQAINKVDEMTLEAIHEVLQSCVTVFVEAYGPQLVSIDVELQNPDLSDEDREQLEHIRTELEQQAPPIAQTLPPLMVGLSLLNVVHEELTAQSTAENVTKSIYDTTYAPLLETVDTLNFFISKYIEIYGDAYASELMTEESA